MGLKVCRNIAVLFTLAEVVFHLPALSITSILYGVYFETKRE
jgi:hypothetical protein